MANRKKSSKSLLLICYKIIASQIRISVSIRNSFGKFRSLHGSARFISLAKGNGGLRSNNVKSMIAQAIRALQERYENRGEVRLHRSLEEFTRRHNIAIA